MAATKKALAIRATKDSLRAELAEMNNRMLEAARKVPHSVLNGFHQDVTAWKDQAEKAVFGVLHTGPQKATVEMLEALRQQKAQQLQVLEGGAA